jgi:hypothetical protein
MILDGDEASSYSIARLYESLGDEQMIWYDMI